MQEEVLSDDDRVLEAVELAVLGIFLRMSWALDACRG